MPSRVAVLAIDAVDVEAVATFWCQVPGHEVVERDEGIVSIAGTHGPAIDVLTVAVVKTVKNRLHLDLQADGTSTAEELARLEGLGTRRVDIGQSADVSWTVLTDPEGNEFCLAVSYDGCISRTGSGLRVIRDVMMRRCGSAR